MTNIGVLSNQQRDFTKKRNNETVKPGCSRYQTIATFLCQISEQIAIQGDKPNEKLCYMAIGNTERKKDRQYKQNVML